VTNNQLLRMVLTHPTPFLQTTRTTTPLHGLCWLTDLSLVDKFGNISYPPLMSSQEQTLSLTHDTPDAQRQPVPGLVQIWTPKGPTYIPREGGDKIVIGRDTDAGFDLRDVKISRLHCTIHRRDGLWQVQDEGSRNGTFVDGVAISGAVTRTTLTVLRVGHCLFLPVENIRGYEGGSVEYNNGMVVGPKLRRVWQEIQHKGGGRTLHITGESGSGKEYAARLFHKGTPEKFHARNCATIPTALAESILFGSREGAFTGAKNVKGLIQVADGGTLFLDEIGELPLDLQAKLLRVLESSEVYAVGATQPVKVEFRMCSATHKDLSKEVGSGRFRLDLYHRLAHPQVCIPALRERAEEIPWLIHRKLSEKGMSAHSSLVEACILRFWPGNVRELHGELESAGATAGSTRGIVEAADLRPAAGLPLPFNGTLTKTADSESTEIHAGEHSDPESGTVGPGQKLVNC
jgi:hypothetical protein